MKEDIQKDVKVQVDSELDSVENDIGALRAELDHMKEEMQKLLEMVKMPFHHDRSVVIYRLYPDEELDDDELIDWLLTEIFGVSVTR